LRYIALSGLAFLFLQYFLFTTFLLTITLGVRQRLLKANRKDGHGLTFSTDR
jgi:hypothetical protein